MKSLIKRQLGHALSWLRPDVVRKIESELETQRMPGWSDSLVERLVLESVIARHQAAHDEEMVVRSHKTFWSGDRALEFHRASDQRIENNAFGKHGALFEELQRVLAEGRYHRLCEIGCGSGVLTNLLAERLPILTEVIGLDLCPEQAKANKKRFADPRLSFVAADAATWVPEHAKAGTVYLTYDGVLEYFAQGELEAMLRGIAAHAPVCFALMEPIAHDYDLDREVQSRLYGREMALSHNYPRAFTAAGFRIHWRKELPLARYLMMIALK